MKWADVKHEIYKALKQHKSIESFTQSSIRDYMRESGHITGESTETRLTHAVTESDIQSYVAEIAFNLQEDARETNVTQSWLPPNAHKGGRTESIHLRLTPDELATLDKWRGLQSRSDYIMSRLPRYDAITPELGEALALVEVIAGSLLDKPGSVRDRAHSLISDMLDEYRMIRDASDSPDWNEMEKENREDAAM